MSPAQPSPAQPSRIGRLAHWIGSLLLAAVLSGSALAACGDGIYDSGEACDDGNTVACDGCSASCQSECSFSCHIDESYVVVGTLSAEPYVGE